MDAPRIVLVTLLICGCVDPLESAETGEIRETGGSDSVPIETAEPILWDRDQDGFFDGEDCNDYDDEVYPGAEESWNAVDDDCNGRIDADGLYIGSVEISGGVVIQGVETVFAMSCPVEMTRSQATLELETHCTPQEEDAIEVLGEDLWLTVSDTGLSGPSWSGRGLLLSSQGWDTTLVELELVWTDFSAATLVAVMNSSTASLGFTGSGDLEVQEPVE